MNHFPAVHPLAETKKMLKRCAVLNLTANAVGAHRRRDSFK